MLMKRNGILFIYIRAFLLFIAIPILVINVLLNNEYKSVVLKNYTENVTQSLEQIRLGLEEEVKRTKLAMSVIANSRDLTDLLIEWNNEKDSIKRFEISRTIEKQLDYLFNYSEDIISLVFFFNDHDVYFYHSNPKSPASIRKKEWVSIANQNEDSAINLGYIKTLSNNKYITNVLASVIKPKTHAFSKNIELIYLEVDSIMFNSIRQQQRSGNKRYVIDSQGKIIIEPSNAFNGKYLNEVEELSHLQLNVSNNLNNLKNSLRHDYYVSKVYSKKLDWYIIDVIPIENITNSIRRIIYIFYPIFIIILFLFTIYIFMHYKQIIIPIKKLAGMMKRVKEHNLDVLSDVSGPEEIQELSTTFNDMMKSINTLIIQRDEKERLRNEEEIKALQAQINPHFIYNTLNTIKLMAMMIKANNIKNTLDSFMKVIELTFKKQETMLSVNEEINYLKAYVSIMKVRYGDFFDLAFTVEGNADKCSLMKMLVQPFVENAIIHGINEKQDGIISVSFTIEDDFLIIQIEDNGIGMTNEEINNLLHKQKENKGGLNAFGISNVKKRIELTYGSPYSVEITSELGEYTRVLIRLPKIFNIGGDSNG